MKIGLTGLNATDNPGPGVPVARSLKESESLNADIIGLIYDTLEPGVYMKDIASKSYLIPYPSSGLENLYERLKGIHSKEKLDFIIPNLDSEIPGFIKLEPKLNELGIKMFLPTLEQFNMRSKDKLFDFCTKNKIKVPKNILVSSFQDLNSASKDFQYPVVVKGIFYDAYIANNHEEVVTAFKKISLKWGLPIIIQEHLKGSEYNVVALGDGTGRTIGAVPMRKMYITEKGKGWAGISIDDKNLLQISYQVIEAMKWRSGLELEFIKSAATNEFYLLEINPRFPAWVYLGTAAGQNMPEAMIKLALKEKVEPYTSFKVGTMFVRSAWDLITDINVFEKFTVNGEL
ncbi:MAG: ATP-grasp domain-containing protein [Ignavibacteriaceae bacterium]|nr:ATP-grasp domain-containing protein [Ignavibacteriaceae bacterium]